MGKRLQRRRLLDLSDPADPDYIYAEYQGGRVGRVNRHTLEARIIQPKPNYKEKLRFNWNTPLVALA